VWVDPGGALPVMLGALPTGEKVREESRETC
jgi:hypothetical protein